MRTPLLAALGVLALAALPALAQPRHDHAGADASGSGRRQIGMDKLHRAGGVPPVRLRM